MERKEKGVGVVMERQRQGKKKEELESENKRKLKLKGGMLVVGKRGGGPSTPSPTWRLEFSSLERNNNSNTNPIQEFLNTNTTVSARKLCANLWEIQPHLHLPPSNCPKQAHHRSHYRKNKSFQHTYLADQPSCPPDQPASASPSTRHVVQSLMQRRQPVDRNAHAVKPLSSASCDSTIEVAAYNPPRTPCSLDLKGKMGESSYGLKTSAELLRVLNRIWSLEEKQSCNISLLKSLKMELEHSQSQIKELLKEKEANRLEMDDLMKQAAEDKVHRKNKEQDRVKFIIQSAQKELENERKLRKRSESLHRQLARELSEAKSAFSNALKELERERKARILLENLCDEFAKGIRDYEREVRSLRHKPEVDHTDRGKSDRLVLHISEAWLDERMQMRLAEGQNDHGEKNTIVDKLSIDIETFLEARHSNGLKKDVSFGDEAINKWSRRESFPLNEAVSAPQAAADEEDSIHSDLRCLEPHKSAGKRQSLNNSKRRGNISSEGHIEEAIIAGSRENSKGRSLAGLHARFNLNDPADYLVRNRSMSSEGVKIYPEGDIKEESCVEPVLTGYERQTEKWTPKLASPEYDNFPSSKGMIKENTLKAMLLEARLECQRSRPRVSQVPI